MKPALLRLREGFGDRLTLRVSIDHYGRAVHELERGRRSWAPTIDGLVWLADNGFSINVASRYLSGEPEAVLRRGFARLFAELGIALDAERRIAPKALDKFKTQVREMTRRTRGISLPQADRRADAA